MTRAASHDSLVSTWAGTRAQTLDDMVTVSDEPPFTKGLLARSRVQHDDHVCLPLARTDRRRYVAENPGRRTVVQPLRYDSGGDELQVPVHVVIPGHLHSLLARDRLDHRQRLGAGGVARVEQGSYDALPPACFHVFDGGIEVCLQLTQMTAQVPQHAIRRDRIPVGPLNPDAPASPVRKADWTVRWKAWPAVSRSTPTRSSAQYSRSPVVQHLSSQAHR